MSIISTIILAFSIATCATLLIPTWPIITIKTNKGRKITRAGWTFFVACLILIFAPVIQDYFQRKDAKEIEGEQKVEADKRDSVNRKQYQTSVIQIIDTLSHKNQQTVQTISEILGKYGYALDLSEKRLTKLIKDSAKRTIEPVNPVLQIEATEDQSMIEMISHENGNYKYKANFMSSGAASTGINLLTSAVISDSLNQYFYLAFTPNNLFPDTEVLPANKARQVGFFLSDIYNFSVLYIWVRGSYMDLEKKKTFPINQVVFFNQKARTSGSVIGNMRKHVLELVKANEH